MALTLRVTSLHSYALGAQSTKTFDTAGGTIGRDSDNDWVLPDPERFISTTHAAIAYRDGNYYLHDLSTNGTFYNGSSQPIGKGQEQPLSVGDRLQIGEYEIVVVTIDSSVYDSVTEARDARYDAAGPKPAPPAPRVDPGSFGEATSADPATSIPDNWDTTGFVLHQPALVRLPPAPRSPAEESPKQPALNLVEVLLATDRKFSATALTHLGGSTRTYGTIREPDGTLSYDRCLVNIPPDHRIGRVERPFSILGIPLRAEDPAKDVIIVEWSPADAATWFGWITGADVLLFVHGYNVACHDAILRTAQLKYDLQFPGRAVCYSWPSIGQAYGYFTDANNTQWSVPHLAALVQKLRTTARAIHVIAHSMGNRVLLGALAEVLRTADTPALGQIMMAAPDIDADVFKELTRGIHARVVRMTLYASSNDEALALSTKLQGGYPRAGQTTPSVVCTVGVDTIDASDVATGLIQHSYYGDNRSVITDMHSLLRSNSHPRERFGMKELALGELKYWAFKP